MSTDDDGIIAGTFDPKALPGMHAERTTAEVVADIVAENPGLHSTSLEERKRRAIADAAASAAEEAKFFDEPDAKCWQSVE